MTGHFEKGKWIDEGVTIDKKFIPICIDFDANFNCSKQVDRVASLLNIPSLDWDQTNGEMIIKGASGKWYRIFDFWEYFLMRMK